MPSENRSLSVDGVEVEVGTSIYDAEHDRVLWITELSHGGVTVEPVTDYEAEGPDGWTPDGYSEVITEGTMFTVREFKALVRDGRFEISPAE